MRPAAALSEREALRALLRAGKECGSPELVEEDDGDLCLDWGNGARVLSVSVGSDGRLRWSALVGAWSGHGTCAGEPDAALHDAFARYTAEHRSWERDR